MANLYSTEYATFAPTSGIGDKVYGNKLNGKVMASWATITAGGAVNDVVYATRLPPNAKVLGGILAASATRGAGTTVSIGIPGDADAFGSAIDTTVTTKTEFAGTVAAGFGYETTADTYTDVIVTLTGAAHSAVEMRVAVFYSTIE